MIRAQLRPENRNVDQFRLLLHNAREAKRGVSQSEVRLARPSGAADRAPGPERSGLPPRLRSDGRRKPSPNHDLPRLSATRTRDRHSPSLGMRADVIGVADNCSPSHRLLTAAQRRDQMRVADGNDARPC